MLFILFAASFLGMFEMNILTGFSNKMDRKADKGGYVSAFFMALVMTIVSFSCTGPFVASLLVEASFGASVLKPILGMFAFGLAMGSPFIVLSLFPALLKKMPKSGGWLNSIKVVFAFIMMAFSMKFLLNIDTAYNLNLFTREVYLSIWIVIFTLMGLYLLGKIKFSHDSEVKHIGVFRLLCVITTFSFVLYLFTGLFGAKLENIASLLPAASTNSYEISSPNHSSNDIQVKYGDRLHLPDNRFGFFDYDEGLAYAKKVDKPILLVFKGHSCSVCKQMEAESWGKPEISALLDKFVIIALYGDDKMELPENEWITSALDGKVKKTMGKKNVDFELSRFKTNQQPYYVILDKDGNQLGNGIGYAKTDKFAEFLGNL
jgi:thiol:disulfide interchange protein DsbD